MIDTDFLLEENNRNRYMPLVSAYRRHKVEKLRFPKDRALSLGAGLLLAYALAGKGVDERSAAYKEGEYGKPAIDGLPFHFSLSHSGHRSVCMLDDAPCGIDIEGIASYKKRIVDRMFSEQEQIFLEQSGQDESGKAETFARIWTRRESYGKLVGRGLDFTDNIQGRLFDDAYIHTKGIYFKEFRIPDETESCSCLMSACSERREITDLELTELKDMEEIICVINRN